MHLPHRRHRPRGCPGLLDVERAPEPADDGAVAALRTRPRDARVHGAGVARAELDPDHVFKRGRVVDAAVKRSAQEGFGRLLRGDVRAGPRAPVPRVEPVVPTRRRHHHHGIPLGVSHDAVGYPRDGRRRSRNRRHLLTRQRVMDLVHVPDVEALVEVLEPLEELGGRALEQGHVKVPVGLAVDGVVLVDCFVKVRGAVVGMGARHFAAVQRALEERAEDGLRGLELGVEVEEDGAVVHAVGVRGGVGGGGRRRARRHGGSRGATDKAGPAVGAGALRSRGTRAGRRDGGGRCRCERHRGAPRGGEERWGARGL